MGKRTSVYLSTEVAAAVAASGMTLPDLVRRGLPAGLLSVPVPVEDRLDDIEERLAKAERFIADVQEGRFQ
jgi:hypothetical protein